MQVAPAIALDTTSYVSHTAAPKVKQVKTDWSGMMEMVFEEEDRATVLPQTRTAGALQKLTVEENLQKTSHPVVKVISETCLRNNVSPIVY